MPDIADLIWILITQLGEDRFYLVVLVVVYLGVERKLGANIATFAMTSVWSNSVIKDLLMIPRPPPQYWKVQAEGYGFPSGHAQGSTVLMGYLAKKAGTRVAYAIAISLIFLVSCSRIALGVHSVFDVVGGVIIGLAILAIGWLVESRLTPSMPRDQAKFLWLSLPIACSVVSTLTGLGGDDSFKATGALFGLLAGYMILEVKRTREPGSILERAANVVAGLVVAVSLYYTVGKTVTGALPVFLALAATGFLASIVPIATARAFKPTGEESAHRT